MASANILVVEYDSIVARDIKQSLEKLGFTLAGIACSGEDAIKLTELTKPDAILMDIRLKGEMDGIEASKKINERFSIPIIYLSASQDKHTIEKSKQTKPYGYLLKPVNERDLNACLRMALYRFDTEKKLRESEERYFRLTENARDMIFRISIINGIYEYVNKASFDLTGYTPQEFYSTPMLIEKIIHPDWKNYFRALWERMKEGSVPEIFEYQIINKAGETKWLNQRNVLIKNDSNVPAALEGIVTDVTGRKKAEGLLRKQTEEYRLILDSMPAMVLVKDYDNKLLKVNKQAAAKKGVKIEEMEGKYSEEFYFDESGEKLKIEREIMISGIPRLDSIEIYSKGPPERKWAKVDRFPYRNEKGEITGVIVFSQDITEQKKTEDELKKIEAKNTAILNAWPDLIFKVDSEGRVLEYKANDKELNILPVDFMNKKVHEFLQKDLADDIMQNIKKALDTGKVQIYEYKREAEDKAVEYEIRFVKSGENEVLELVRDITERKQIEIKLRESEARYRNLTDKAPICLTRLLVKERKYEFANAEFVRQSGYTLEEFNNLTDKQLNDLIHPEDRDTVLKEYDKWAKEGCPGVKHITYRLTNKSGNLLWLDTYHYADYDSTGKIYAINQIYIDVTEQKKSEHALKLSEEKFRSVADTAHAVIFIYQDDKFVYGNSNAEVLTGYSLEELYKMNFWEIIHPDYREEATRRGKARQQGDNNLSRYEMKIVCKDGNEKWVDFSASLFEYNGRLAVLGTAIDITERKKAEEALKGSLIEKEILLKEIHHRVKNNLQIVSSLLKLQSTYIKDKDSLGLFKESQNRVQSMALIHQKLYQARDLTNINFCEYAGNLISYLLQTFGITPDFVEISIQPDKVYMSIDNAIPAGLIINELVTNSIKHGFPDNSRGKIDINTSYNELTENYTLIVHDNGVGISEEIDINNSPSFGLKLVTTLADQMKGCIEVIRENGTKFIVTMKNAQYKERA